MTVHPASLLALAAARSHGHGTHAPDGGLGGILDGISHFAVRAAGHRLIWGLPTWALIAIVVIGGTWWARQTLRAHR